MKRKIIGKEDIKPSSPCLKVLGVLNPGVATYKGKTILLLRVAEVPVEDKPSKAVACYIKDGKVESKEFDKTDESYDFSDHRIITSVNGKKRNFITSISHLRLAISDDGVNFDIADTPTIEPKGIYEEYGIEDARINQIGDKYYITYSCGSRYGIVVGLIETNDFKTFERKGYLFHPDNKDVVLFPKKINGLYYAIHRPSSSNLGDLSMWLASSNDLLRFGDYKHLLSPFKGTERFDNYRIGAGCPPIELPDGYLEIYHGATKEDVYKIGALLLDKNNPLKILKISKIPILEPSMDFEINGFTKNVVFPCGAVLKDDTLNLYYGAADDSVGVATLSLKQILNNMEDFSYEKYFF